MALGNEDRRSRRNDCWAVVCSLSLSLSFSLSLSLSLSPPESDPLECQNLSWETGPNPAAETR